MTTVVIVDDHPPFRNQMRQLLEADGFSVVGEAETVAEGLKIVRTVRPDLALIDVGLPDGDGFDLADMIQRGGSPRPILVMTSSRSPASYRSRLAATGAAAFIVKDELSGSELRAVLAGNPG